MKTRNSTSGGWDRTARTVSFAIILIALVVLVGWYAHISVAVQIFPGLVPMQYNTALCFLALGVAGIGLSPRRQLLMLCGGSFAALMGGAVILEYATGVSIGIDTLFFYPWDPALTALTADAGRMALTTAISFVLTGGALVILAVRPGAYDIFGIVNSITLSLALTSLVGYSFGITYILPFNLGSQMALNTSAAFFAYGIAMLGYAWKYAERGTDGLPKWGAGIGAALLPVLLVAASALFPEQSWRAVPLEALISIVGVALITLAVRALKTAKVAYKGLLITAIPLILLLVFVGLVVRVKHQSESALVAALRSNEVIGVSQSLLGRIAEAERAVRGYVLTDDETFVDSYERSLESVAQTTTQLRSLVADNAIQETSAENIEELVALRMDYLRQTVGFVKTADREQAEAIVKRMKGTDLMERVRAEMRGFSQEEERIGAEGRRIMDASWQRLSWLLVAGTAAAILLASILILLFSGGISRRLQRLRDNAISLAAGKELAAPLDGNDEIAELDRVFHKMAESLDEVTRREKAVIEGTTDGIFVKDLDHRFLMINPAGADFLGDTVEGIIGSTVHDVLTPESAQRIDELEAATLSEGKTTTREIRTSTKAGVERTFLTTRGPYRDRHGSVVGIIGINRDITERKRAEAERQAVVEIVQGVFATATLDELFSLIHVSIGKLLYAENCFVALYDKASGLLHIPFCKDKFDPIAEPQKLGRGLTAFVLRSGRPMLLTPGLIQELASRGEIELVGTLPAAWLGVPLRTSNEIVGVLVVQHYEDKDAYGQRDLDLLATVGDQLALAIERKQAEEALIESDRRFRDLFYDAPVGYHELDIEGRITCVNTTELLMLGYTSDEMIGHHVWEFIEEEETARKTFAEKLGGQKPHRNVERSFRRKDGTFMAVQLDDQMLKDPSGRLIGIRATMQDIVERKRTEEALIQSEQRFRDLFENASDVIYTADFEGNFTSLNKSGEQVTGYTREEALHLNFSQVVSPETLKLVQEMTRRKLESRDETVYEVEFFKKNGEPLLVEVSSRAIYQNGKPVGIQGIGRDITQRKQVEADLKLARDAALESVRLKSDFLANMSHEIRTPMNGVIGMTGLLLDSDLTAEQRDCTESINVSAEALLTIIDDILDFSKIEAGLMRFEKIGFELRGAVEAPVELLAERAQAKGLELASIVYDDVPTSLLGDPGRLRQVLTNLIGNAVKFTGQGEVVVSVTKVSENASRAMLRFEVQDTGIGIPAEAQKGLFRAFIQADGSTTRKYGGTGLGLAISKQLVELMGGQIGIESTPGQGSKFWFTAEFDKQNQHATRAGETAGTLAAVRVLIVDDNATNRRILSHQTRSWAMIATEAESGKQALELLRAEASRGQHFDIAILDLMMPEMDGFQLAEAIKADPSISAVALVLLPSYGKRGHGQKARQVGIAAYLQKPVRQSQLHACLTAVMTRSTGIEPITETNLVTRHSMREAEVQQADKTVSKVRIIIAEDNIVNQKVALGQLSRLGYRAEAVRNGLELIEAMEGAEFDLILMDCQMPEMDGFAATAEIRRREGAARHTTIIAMTANALDGDEAKCLAAGMDDYLSKPVKVEILRQKLERWTSSAERATFGEGLTEGAVSTGNTQGNVLNQAQLANLRAIQEPGEADIVAELIDLFVDETISQLKLLHKAVASNDLSEIRRLAHFLMGSSASIGAQGMSVLYRQLEGLDGSNGDAEALLKRLDGEFELVHEALKVERRGTAD